MSEFRVHPFRVRYPYSDAISQHRAHVALLTGSVIFAVSVVVIALMLTRPTQNPGGVIIAIAPVWAVIGVNIVLFQTGRLYAASVLLVAALMVGLAINVWAFGLGATTLLPFALVVALSVALLGTREGLIALGIAGLLVGVALYAQLQGAIQRTYEPVAEVVYSFAYLLVLTQIIGLSTATLKSALAGTVRTASRLRAAAQASAAIAAERSLDALLRESVAQVREGFGFYHAQVFLISEDGAFAVLRASTGRVGRRMLARGHRLEVGSHSVVGRTALLNEPVLASHTDPVHRPNPLLPDTRTELGLPLRVGDRLVGVLDVQSTEENAFSPDDVASLQALANQLAVAIENLRLLEDTRAQLADKQRALEETQARLREAERQNQYLTGEAWGRYLSGRGLDLLGYDWQAGQLARREHWSSGMAAAMSEGRVLVRQEDGRQVLTVPVAMRRRALGAVELVNALGHRWDDEHVELAQEVVNRLVLALETARLTEDAQRLAERERAVNAVSAELQGVQDMAGLLTRAATEIRLALGAQATTVRLGGAHAETAEP